MRQHYITSALYNIYLHPLSNHPGPRYLAASRLPIAYAYFTGKATFWIKELHDKYGPVVRVAPNDISYASSDAWSDIFGNHPAYPGGMPRDPKFFSAVEDKSCIPTMLSANNAQHTRLRRAYAVAFSKRTLLEQETMMMYNVDLLIQKLYETKQQPTNMTNMFIFTSFDVIANLQFGESLHLLDNMSYNPWLTAIRDYTRASMILWALADFLLVRVTVKLFATAGIKERAQFFKFTDDKVKNRLSNEVNSPDFVKLVSHPSAKIKLSEEEICANAPALMQAGSDTTAGLLSGFMAYILTTPEAFAHLSSEIRTAFKQSSEVTVDSVERLKWLDSCVKETMRIYPNPPNGPPRLVPECGAKISGKWVVGGTRVYISPYATYRSSANFYKADSFLPQRWDREPNSCFLADCKDAFHPFSTGKRDCIGQK